jgi:single-strand DNA-binding protein
MVNKVILIGNLGADPEVRYTQNGIAITNFNVATTEKWKNKEGAWEDKTEWHRIVTFRRLAETCSEYLSKGSKVYVEGRLRTQKWEDRDGNTRKTTEIEAQVVKFLSPKGTENMNQDAEYRKNQNAVEENDQFVSDVPTMGDDVPF